MCVFEPFDCFSSYIGVSFFQFLSLFEMLRSEMSQPSNVLNPLKYSELRKYFRNGFLKHYRNMSLFCKKSTNFATDFKIILDVKTQITMAHTGILLNFNSLRVVMGGVIYCFHTVFSYSAVRP